MNTNNAAAPSVLMIAAIDLCRLSNGHGAIAEANATTENIHIAATTAQRTGLSSLPGASNSIADIIAGRSPTTAKTILANEAKAK